MATKSTAPRTRHGTDEALTRFGAPTPTRIDAWALPRGRHAHAQAEDIASAQRARMLYAIVTAVAEKSYGGATVADIARIAGVSRSAFYAQFTDKEDCFLAAYESAHYAVAEQVRACQHEGMDWHQRLQASLRAYLDFKRDNPVLARTLLVDIHAAGARARAKRDWGHRRFAAMQERLYALRRAAEPGLPELPGLLFVAMVAAVEEMVADYVCRGQTARVHEVEGMALGMLEAVYGGPPRPSAGRMSRGPQR